ncbi:MAG: carboxy-S-adenosyl-L-methionine synthase CmoA [Gammaproteobacteria bacterium]|nr:carboxy-S-adenosyl-L-methionine synthase CmoA [Gammaproteobacteria bacterium]
MSQPPQFDALYAKPRPHLVDFCFDATVAAVFADMVRRSVPGYEEVLRLLPLFAERYIQPQSTVYDLGCSLGASTFVLRQQAPLNSHFVAIDSAPEMVSRARQNLANTAASAPLPTVEVCCADIRHAPLTNASLVLLNLTLQFIPPAERLPLLQRIATALRPEGILLLIEKIRSDSETEEHFIQQLHQQFKRANGYSELEISQKRSALERVLISETVESHKARLLAAGFSQVYPWFRSLNFVALAALR